MGMGQAEKVVTLWAGYGGVPARLAWQPAVQLGAFL